MTSKKVAWTAYLPAGASFTEQEKFIAGSTNLATICISTICRSNQ